MIHKSLFTIWLNEKSEYPPLIKKCIESQERYCKENGYIYKIITLENFYKGSIFTNDAIRAKRWVKASDYLRIHYLYTEGGIYLDADMEILEGKGFNKILEECDREGFKMFTSKEVEGFYSNASLGAEPGHPLLKEYLRRLDENFRGDGDLTFESGVRAFCDLFYISDLLHHKVKIYPTDYFFPYNHATKETKITENTIIFHYYNNSWITDRTL